jgi:hypothetical protein
MDLLILISLIHDQNLLSHSLSIKKMYQITILSTIQNALDNEGSNSIMSININSAQIHSLIFEAIWSYSLLLMDSRIPLYKTFHDDLININKSELFLVDETDFMKIK